MKISKRWGNFYIQNVEKLTSDSTSTLGEKFLKVQQNPRQKDFFISLNKTSNLIGC